MARIRIAHILLKCRETQEASKENHAPKGVMILMQWGDESGTSTVNSGNPRFFSDSLGWKPWYPVDDESYLWPGCTSYSQKVLPQGGQFGRQRRGSYRICQCSSSTVFWVFILQTQPNWKVTGYMGMVRWTNLVDHFSHSVMKVSYIGITTRCTRDMWLQIIPKSYKTRHIHIPGCTSSYIVIYGPHIPSCRAFNPMVVAIIVTLRQSNVASWKIHGGFSSHVWITSHWHTSTSQLELPTFCTFKSGSSDQGQPASGPAASDPQVRGVVMGNGAPKHEVSWRELGWNWCLRVENRTTFLFALGQFDVI